MYHIFYALACKENYFNNFEDYDSYSMYSAARLFILLRDKYIKAGTVIRGREIQPVKSVLNFIKSIMRHFRTDFQNETFAIVLNPDINQDTSTLEADMKESIKSDYRNDLAEDFIEIFTQVPMFIKQVIKQTPYKKDPVMCRKLYMSCLLTFINDITIPERIKNKLKKIRDSKEGVALRMYQYNLETPIL